MHTARTTFWPMLVGAAAAVALVGACDRHAATTPATTPPESTTSSPVSSAGGAAAVPSPAPPAPPRVTFLERTTGGARADETLPLVVAIHGMGDAPENWLPSFDGFSVRARILLPRAPQRYFDGWSWFTYPPASVESLSRGISDAADAVADLVAWAARARPTRGKPIVTGFSQGGFLSFAIAVRYPGLVDAAIPVSGGLPPPLWPSTLPDGVAPPPIFAMHGTADTIVKIGPTRDAVARLRSLGWPVSLDERVGAGHVFDAEAQRTVEARIAARLR